MASSTCLARSTQPAVRRSTLPCRTRSVDRLRADVFFNNSATVAGGAIASSAQIKLFNGTATTVTVLANDTFLNNTARHQTSQRLVAHSCCVPGAHTPKFCECHRRCIKLHIRRLQQRFDRDRRNRLFLLAERVRVRQNLLVSLRRALPSRCPSQRPSMRESALNYKSLRLLVDFVSVPMPVPVPVLAPVPAPVLPPFHTEKLNVSDGFESRPNLSPQLSPHAIVKNFRTA